MTDRIERIVEALCAQYRAGYNGDVRLLDAASRSACQCWSMGLRQRLIDQSTHTLETYGRGRITDASTAGFWIQIDHDRSRIEQLQEAVSLLDGFGLIERHPRLGNPRNVRILEPWGKA